jgi:DNA-binding NarL/FixJ family response regulator
VKIHVTAIFKSMNVKNRTQAVISAARYAIR